MKTKYLVNSVLYMLVCFLVLQTNFIFVSGKQKSEIVIAQTITSVCIRKISTVKSQCLMTVSKGKYMNVLSGTVNGFIKVKYLVSKNKYITGWVLKNKIILIYN